MRANDICLMLIILPFVIAGLALGCSTTVEKSNETLTRSLASSGKTREYWIVAESEPWQIAGKASSIIAIRFHAYSPDFKQRLPEDADLGIAGPILEARVGDHVLVHFKNMDAKYRLPHSIHVHGFEYTAEMDGSYSKDEPNKGGSAVKYGETFTYEYDVSTDSVGIWLYHDHSLNEEKSVGLGLYGAIRIRAENERIADREYFLFMSGMEKDVTGLDRDFDTFNGRAFMENTPMFKAKKGESVRFNVLAIGSEFHTFHVHGYRWKEDGKPADVRLIGPAQTWTTGFVADKPGNWMYHCHVAEHMKNGMMGMFMVN